MNEKLRIAQELSSRRLKAQRKAALEFVAAVQRLPRETVLPVPRFGKAPVYPLVAPLYYDPDLLSGLTDPDTYPKPLK